MRYFALATDYDGTLAHDGGVNSVTIKALERLRHSGRKLILVTGRELPDLESVFSRTDLFDRIVAENGAVLYNPASREKRLLAPRPPDEFVENLRRRGVKNISFGEVIVATWHPYETAAVEAIRECGLELQVIFNKDAVMILPSGTNKMTGLSAALDELKLSAHNVVGVGDAENDHAFLACCECSVAVANAIPSLKERVDLVTEADRGAGVCELIEKILADDLASLDSALKQRGVILGHADEEDVLLAPYGNRILLCGESGSGKSTLVAGLLESLMHRGYQVCLIDPEGDYEGVGALVQVGDQDRAPATGQVLQLLDRPGTDVAVNLIGLKMTGRADFFASLFATLQEKRLHEGRPHWIVVDEAHHMLPSEWAPASAQVTADLGNVLLVTVHPEHVSPAALGAINIVLVVGKEPHLALEEFARAIGVPVPRFEPGDLGTGEALVWFRDADRVLPKMKAQAGRAERNRHRRKYAEGELEPERVFYFRGPANKLHLRAQNLAMFLQIAEGVDDETWLYHLKRGDYSRWLRDALKDAPLADEVGKMEKDASRSAKESRAEIAKAIEAKYTAPA